jgi:hypothetical protein
MPETTNIENSEWNLNLIINLVNIAKEKYQNNGTEQK